MKECTVTFITVQRLFSVIKKAGRYGYSIAQGTRYQSS